MGEACPCGAWVGRLEQHECPESKAVSELASMMMSIAADWSSWFRMGKFQCRRVLSNGAVVRVSITMPTLATSEGSDDGR